MRKLATAAAVSLALASGGAFGLGLGDIEMRSALNQPMNAEIPLTSVKNGELDGMIVELADPAAFARAGIERSTALTDLKFTVESSGGRPIIRISSDRPVVEPFLNFLLEIDWPQGRMVREYTVLLDPPVFMTQGPSIRDAGADRPAVAATDSALVAPAPIRRTPSETGDEPGPDAGLAGGGDLSDEELLAQGGDITSLDELDADSASLPANGASGGNEIAPLSDSGAPNTRAAADRAARATTATTPSDEQFEVELLGDGAEVGDEVGDVGEETVSLDEIDATAAADVPDEITVRRGDTLFEIAEANLASGVSVQQMMLALLEANRSAFINDNINLVKAGAILRVPQAAEASALSQAQALAEIGRQSELWRQYRDNLRGSIGGTRIASGENAADTADTTLADAADADADAGADVDAGGADESGLSENARAILESARNEVRSRDELRIVAEDSSASGTASATADETEGSDAARLGEINRQLQLAREELSTARLEGSDLDDQASELQSTSENLDALVLLRQNEIARLEGQLAEARAGSGSDMGGAAETDAGTGADANADADAVAGADAETRAAVAGADADTLADASDVLGTAAGAVGRADDAAASAADVIGDTADELAEMPGEAAETTEDALATAGESLEEGTLSGDSDADGAAATIDAEDGEAAALVATAPAVSLPWYRSLLSDPTRLGIAGAGALGLLGLLGTLLWRRRASDDEDSLAGFQDENESRFFEENETGGGQAGDDASTGGAAAAAGVAAAGGAFAAPGDGTGDASAGLGGDASGLAFGTDGEADGGSTVDSPTAVDADTDDGLDKDDTISEADVYLAYGLHGQAEELLAKAIERDPHNQAYVEKLLQTYHAQGNGEGFERAATDFHARFGGASNPEWNNIVAMGRELRPDAPMFAAAAGSVAALGTGRLDGPQLDDEDFLASPDGAEEVTSSISRDFGAVDEPLEFDEGAFAGSAGGVLSDESLEAGDGDAGDGVGELDDETALMEQSLDPAFAFDEGDLEATGDFSQIASELAAEDDGSFDLQMPGDDAASADDESVVDASPENAPADQGPLTELPDEGTLEDALTLDELDVDAAATAANDAGDESGLGGLSDELTLDLDELAAADDGIDLDATSLDATEFDTSELLGGITGDVSDSLLGSGGDDFGIPDLATHDEPLDGVGGIGDASLDDSDEMDTMMDLAKAYIDMGDKDSASNALDEIVKGGNPEQISEAETLLRKIS